MASFLDKVRKLPTSLKMATSGLAFAAIMSSCQKDSGMNAPVQPTAKTPVKNGLLAVKPPKKDAPDIFTGLQAGMLYSAFDLTSYEKVDLPQGMKGIDYIRGEMAKKNISITITPDDHSIPHEQLACSKSGYYQKQADVLCVEMSRLDGELNNQELFDLYVEQPSNKEIVDFVEEVLDDIQQHGLPESGVHAEHRVIKNFLNEGGDYIYTLVPPMLDPGEHGLTRQKTGRIDVKQTMEDLKDYLKSGNGFAKPYIERIVKQAESYGVDRIDNRELIETSPLLSAYINMRVGQLLERDDIPLNQIDIGIGAAHAGDEPYEVKAWGGQRVVLEPVSKNLKASGHEVARIDHYPNLPGTVPGQVYKGKDDHYILISDYKVTPEIQQIISGDRRALEVDGIKSLQAPWGRKVSSGTSMAMNHAHR